MDKTQVLDALSALGHDQRLEIFRMLVRAEPAGLLAGDISASLSAPANTVSTNLSILMQAGLVSRQREGRTLRYKARLESMQGLLTYLTEDCCGGHPGLCLPLKTNETCCQDKA